MNRSPWPARKTWLLLAVACALHPVLLHGQRSPSVAGGLEIAAYKGKLQAMNSRRLQIRTAEAQDVFADIGPRTTVSYQGSATAAYLRPGLMVRFRAPFDVTGMPQAALSSMEIFRPIRLRRPSIEQRQAQTPGIYPVNEKDADEGKKQDKGRQQKRQPKATDGQTQPANQNGPAKTYLVVGTLRAVQQNKIQVLAGRRPVIVQLADDVEITVSAGDMTFCAVGDEVEVSGLRSGGQENYVQAESVEITGSATLGELLANGDKKAADPAEEAGKRGASKSSQ